ncbi:MAG: 5-formyltetrahydrofolate cyclo-ligase [Planctomycetes bacterium]|nr:5-formyltetrahydrofolate cyclo-ligase [Planctomycetota bacterium]
MNSSPEHIAVDKKRIRQHCRQARRHIDTQQRQTEQKYIDEKLQEIVDQHPDLALLVYAATADECSCDQLMRTQWQAGKEVYVPKVKVGTQRSLSWHKVSSDDDFSHGYQGIREPITPSVELPNALLILVPGLAFTAAGDRLGMGGGFYDQVLADIQTPSIIIGLAWSCQIMAELPMEAHDQILDQVIFAPNIA